MRNVVAHSHAHKLDIRLSRPDHRAVLEVVDDGVGFDPDDVTRNPAPGHVGLKVMSDLVHDAGGVFDVISGAGDGTKVRLEVPTR